MVSMDIKDKLLAAVLIAIPVALVIGIIAGAMRMHDENSSIKNNCVKTQLVIIGNKGHASPVYDCSKKEKYD